MPLQISNNGCGKLKMILQVLPIQPSKWLGRISFDYLYPN